MDLPQEASESLTAYNKINGFVPTLVGNWVVRIILLQQAYDAACRFCATVLQCSL